VSSFVTLTWLKALPFWIAAVVISRDLILMVGALVIHMAGGRIYPRPTRAGKIATFFQILTVLTGLATRFVQVGPPPLAVTGLARRAERAGARHARRLARRPGADLGVELEAPRAGEIATCANKCVFCFIHQLPKGMRKSLYVKDDDFRLSFLHGNYITLTDLEE